MKFRPDPVLMAVAALVLAMLIAGLVRIILDDRAEHATDTKDIEAPAPERATVTASLRPVLRPNFDEDWLSALPEPADIGSQGKCLAEALYFEARGESVRGQIAVAEVILNRTESDRFPDTICDVVYQGSNRRGGCQFSFACDGAPEIFNEREAHDRARRLAAYLIDRGGIGLSGGAQFFHAVSVQPSWADRLQKVARIGDHVFLRYNDGDTPTPLKVE